MKYKTTSKFVVLGALSALLIATTPGLASAHVVVKPSAALTGAYETFTTSVPNEKDIPVTGLRVVIPESVESVTPTVKPGWEIQTKKDGDRITEISWTGGSIPAEQRDEFTFSAHLPAKSGEITWKAYQTYQDGTIAAWDQKPAEDGHHADEEGKGPYSVTVLSDEVEGAGQVAETQASSSNTILYVISIAALVLAVFALVRTSKK